MTSKILKQCAVLLMEWYKVHYRMLPWRESRDPYRIWISEIMLQQTRIEAAMPYYTRFLETCPTVDALANLPEDRLLKLWEGLGYYSRARNLQKAAKVIVQDYNGHLPADYDKLLALPGVGDYTAGAIASIAFDIAVPAVDGNVMRVLSRLTGDAMDVMSAGAKRHFGDVVRIMLPTHEAGMFNQALMELGETVCLPNTIPNCAECPWQTVCVARAENTIGTLPVRTKKKARTVENRIVAIVRVDGDDPRILLHKRTFGGLLANMWELPNALKEHNNMLLSEFNGSAEYIRDLPSAKHVFSHIEWRMSGRLYHMSSCVVPSDYVAVTLEQLQNDYALPSAFRAYVALLPTLLSEEEI